MARLATIFLLVIVSACSLSPGSKAPPAPVVVNPEKADLSDSIAVMAKMHEQHQAWRGTRYQLGGLSQEGVDCSGFVYVTFREQFGIALPRTTRLQSEVGRKIKRRDLQPGDLVFFKTGIRVRHVGIYLADDEFLHASTSLGVTVSSLNEAYWQDKYWHARRVGS